MITDFNKMNDNLNKKVYRMPWFQTLDQFPNINNQCILFSVKIAQKLIFRLHHNSFHVIKNVNPNHKFSSILLFRCIEPDLCDDNREKTNINPFSSISHSLGGNEDIFNTLIALAQNAKCTEQGTRCCSTKFIASKGTG